MEIDIGIFFVFEFGVSRKVSLGFFANRHCLIASRRVFWRIERVSLSDLFSTTNFLKKERAIKRERVMVVVEYWLMMDSFFKMVWVYF
jgi:hypothetical protein